MAILNPGYHIALVVDDLDEAMADLTRTIGLDWHEPFIGSSHLEVDGELVEAGPRLTFSRQGPPYLELLQRKPNTIWAQTGLHHMGFWTDDVTTESARLESQDARLEASGAQPDGTRTSFCYHRTASGLRVELVDIGRAGPKLTRYLSG